MLIDDLWSRRFSRLCDYVRACSVSCLLCVAVSSTRAQSPNGRSAEQPSQGVLAIAGTVFDSLTLRPLVGAHVHLSAVMHDATTDSMGGFRFDSVRTGTYTIWADHPLLDQIGLSTIGVSVDAVSGQITHVVLATPSLATLWRRVCPTGAYVDSGFVYGVVSTGTTAERMTGTTVELGLPVFAGSADRGDTRRKVQTDAAGNYAICGFPAKQLMSISASGLGATTVPILFRIGAPRIARRDLTLSTNPTTSQFSESSMQVALLRTPDGATLAGVVRDSSGRPIQSARIAISGVAGEWRANSGGGFIVRGIPAGPRVVRISALGLAPESHIVDFVSTDSAYLDLSMRRLPTTLGIVTVEEHQRVNELKSELDQRRRAGFGYRADSLDFAKYLSVGQALNFPGVHVTVSGTGWGIYMTGVYSITGRGGSGLTMTCTPTVWIDGTVSDWQMVNDLKKEEIALVEIYNSAARAPLQYTGTRTNCGIVLIWRKSYVSP
jgi:hypothetical protein